MANFLSILSERQDQLIQAIMEHLGISLISIFIAAAIAIPLAIVLLKFPKVAEGVLQITGVLQTIPSLALLGLLIPIVGIGTVPAVIALVIYGLLPIFQNTYAGFMQIDDSLLEAAEAFGMTKSQKLLRVQLPLALPMMVAGLRISLVMIIGTATLAALIGAGGLGTFILLGIDRHNPNLILIGAISAALLAIIFSYGIKLIEKLSFKKMAITLTALVLILALSVGGTALYNSRSKGKTVVIAGKMGSEPDILINMYKYLIENDSDEYNVELKPHLGNTTFLINALKSKQIDIYPEFTGTVLQSLVNYDKEMSNDPETVYEEGKKELAEQLNFAYLKPMKYQNTYALAVKRSFAEENNIKSISDLAAYRGDLIAGFTLEFKDRSDGYVGLQELYGLNLDVKTMQPKLRYQAIDNGDVQVVDGYSTDSELAQYNLVVLEDDRNLFPPYQGAPLMWQEFADENPKIVESLNKLEGLITEEEMQKMNYQVNVEGKEPSAVARDYLIQARLISE